MLGRGSPNPLLTGRETAPRAARTQGQGPRVWVGLGGCCWGYLTCYTGQEGSPQNLPAPKLPESPGGRATGTTLALWGPRPSFLAATQPLYHPPWQGLRGPSLGWVSSTFPTCWLLPKPFWGLFNKNMNQHICK